MVCDIISIGCGNMKKFKENKKQNESSILSATRPSEQLLKTGYESQPILKTKLKQKSIIKIYVDENKYYIEHSAAYALGLVKTRAIMLDNQRLIEISSEIHNKLKDDDSIEIEYIRREKKQPFNENKNQNKNNVLSITRPVRKILKNDHKIRPILKTQLKQKSIIKIYIKDNKYYIEHGAAYALGLIKTRSIMLDKPKLVEISGEMHNKLINNDSIKIEYIREEKKQPLKIYIDGAQYCMDNSAAYALGFLNVEQFNNPNDSYYYISDDMLNDLKKNFNIEFHSLNLENYSSDKNL